MELQHTIKDEKESLKIIQDMISKTKSHLHDNGFQWMLWGWLVFTASISDYVLLFLGKHEIHWYPWLLMVFGGIVSTIYGFFEERKKRVRTHVEKFLGYHLVAVVIALFIILGVMGILKLNTYPVVLLLYGIMCFVSGGALKFVPLIVGGCICWILSCISFYLSFREQLLILALAVLISYIIPGHILQYRYKKDRHV